MKIKNIMIRIKSLYLEESKVNKGLMIVIAIDQYGIKWVLSGDPNSPTYAKKYDDSFDTKHNVISKEAGIRTVVMKGHLFKQKRVNLPSKYMTDLDNHEWFVKWDYPERGVSNLSLPIHPDDYLDNESKFEVGKEIEFTQSYYCDVHKSFDCAKLIHPNPSPPNALTDQGRNNK